MSKLEARPVNVVGTAIMPRRPRAGDAFWANITGGRYCITDVPPERWGPGALLRRRPRCPRQDVLIIGGGSASSTGTPSRNLPSPTVAAQMDEGQRWAISAARAAMTDAGWPKWNIESDRVAVILGNAIGGEKHYKSSMRIQIPRCSSVSRSRPPRSLSPEARGPSSRRPRRVPRQHVRDHRGHHAR